MRSASTFALVLATTIAVVSGTSVSAHRRDEYLQAARIALQPGTASIELDLTPGIDVADAVISTIDTDRDGVLSGDEQHAYAGEVVRDLEVRLDDVPISLRLIAATYPEVSAFRSGQGTIRLRAVATHSRSSGGAHRFFFRNPHMGGRSVYLANALVPDDDRISVRRQRRDVGQSELTIDYIVRGGTAEFPAEWLLLCVPFAALLLYRIGRRSRPT